MGDFYFSQSKQIIRRDTIERCQRYHGIWVDRSAAVFFIVSKSTDPPALQVSLKYGDEVHLPKGAASIRYSDETDMQREWKAEQK